MSIPLASRWHLQAVIGVELSDRLLPISALCAVRGDCEPPCPVTRGCMHTYGSPVLCGSHCSEVDLTQTELELADDCSVSLFATAGQHNATDPQIRSQPPLVSCELGRAHKSSSEERQRHVKVYAKRRATTSSDRASVCSCEPRVSVAWRARYRYSCQQVRAGGTKWPGTASARGRMKAQLRRRCARRCVRHGVARGRRGTRCSGPASSSYQLLKAERYEEYSAEEQVL